MDKIETNSHKYDEAAEFVTNIIAQRKDLTETQKQRLISATVEYFRKKGELNEK